MADLDALDAELAALLGEPVDKSEPAKKDAPKVQPKVDTTHRDKKVDTSDRRSQDKQDVQPEPKPEPADNFSIGGGVIDFTDAGGEPEPLRAILAKYEKNIEGLPPEATELYRKSKELEGITDIGSDRAKDYMRDLGSKYMMRDQRTTGPLQQAAMDFTASGIERSGGNMGSLVRTKLTDHFAQSEDRDMDQRRKAMARTTALILTMGTKHPTGAMPSASHMQELVERHKIGLPLHPEDLAPEFRTDPNAMTELSAALDTLTSEAKYDIDKAAKVNPFGV